MKILHLISGGDVGGAKTHVLTLLRGLMERHSVVLGCFVDGPFIRDAMEMGIPAKIWAKKNMLSYVGEVADYVAKEQFDLIHCHGAKGNVMGALLRSRLGLPVITTVHSDPWLDYIGRPMANLTYGTANRWALHQMDSFVTVSDSLRELLISRDFDPYLMFTNENGVDFSNLENPTPRGKFLEKLGIDWPRDALIFGIAARLNPIKDISSLIRAFSQVIEKVPRARLLIAGDGEERQKLEALAGQLCPAGSVRFAGWLDDMDGFYNTLDVNVLSSLSEGLPYAIPEGARMHCATVSTRVGAVPRIVIHEKTGLLSPAGDWQALAANLLRVAQDDALRGKLSQAIFDKVRREYSLEATVSRQEAIYERVLSRRKRQLEHRDGVIICGAYGKGNAGDDAILLTMIRQLRQDDPDLPIWVMTRDRRHTALMAGVPTVFTFDFLKAGQIMRRCKLYISGGGSLIQDVTSTRSLLFYLQSIRQAKHNGCKVMMYGCGVGPISRGQNRQLTGRVLDRNVDLITLRDPDSRALLERIGVTRPQIHVTADPALLCPGDPEQVKHYWKEAGLKPDGKYCLFALRPWAGEARWSPAFAAAADYVWNAYGMESVFFTMEADKDLAISQRVAEQVKAPWHILPPANNGSLICGIMAKMGMVVSMRLHALIFASGQGVPVVGVSYDPKVSSFLDYLGQQDYVTLEEVTDGTLCDMIDSAASGGAAEHAIVARLQELANRNATLARQLMTE